jgi:GNAT superfamily N-acetyltransferase
MLMILKAATKEELTLANQRNLIGFFSLSSKHEGMINYFHQQFVEGLYSKLPISILNRIIRTSLKEEQLESKIEELNDFYAKIDSPLYWEVWPTSTPKNLETTLQKQGFTYAEEYPAMVIDLTKVKLNVIGDLEVKQVKTKEDAQLFTNLFQEIYEMPDPPKNDMFHTILASGFDQDLVNYLGYENGKPVSISSIYYQGGVAGIFNVGTKKEHSRKGYGTAITAFPLNEAKNKGYHYGVLQSSEQGEKVYERMGFATLCRVRTYKK